jgi:hypothetical protein
LEADLKSRLERNRSDFRLAKQSSKRDTDRSEKNPLNTDQRYRMNSKNDFFYPEHHIKIDNTNISPEETVQKVITRFGF